MVDCVDGMLDVVSLAIGKTFFLVFPKLCALAWRVQGVGGAIWPPRQSVQCVALLHFYTCHSCSAPQAF